jgi:predicted small secreted protein
MRRLPTWIALAALLLSCLALTACSGRVGVGVSVGVPVGNYGHVRIGASRWS